MDIYDYEDKLIKRIDSISDDMARFISKLRSFIRFISSLTNILFAKNKTVGN